MARRVVAVVSDSYDLFHAIDELWGRQLRDRVVASGGTLVIRPDSGDPVTIVCESLERLMARFGHSTNSNGYRMLPSYVRLIQGDGVSPGAIARILEAMAARGLSAENVAFGMGGELLQNVDRDTLKFAIKASAIEIGGHWSDVYRDPVTDVGKRSKRGRLALVRNDAWRTVPAESVDPRDNALRTVFRDGRLLIDETFDTVRARVHAN